MRRKEVKKMKNLIIAILAVAIFATFSFGCAGVSKETQVECLECGAAFTVDQTLNNIEP